MPLLHIHNYLQQFNYLQIYNNSALKLVKKKHPGHAVGIKFTVNNGKCIPVIFDSAKKTAKICSAAAYAKSMIENSLLYIFDVQA